MSQSSLILIVDLSEMNYCDNGNTTFIIKEFAHKNKYKIRFYYIFNKTLYILLIALCLNNDVIYRSVAIPGRQSHQLCNSWFRCYLQHPEKALLLHFARDIYEKYDEWLKD